MLADAVSGKGRAFAVTAHEAAVPSIKKTDEIAFRAANAGLVQKRIWRAGSKGLDSPLFDILISAPVKDRAAVFDNVIRRHDFLSGNLCHRSTSPK